MFTLMSTITLTLTLVVVPFDCLMLRDDAEAAPKRAITEVKKFIFNECVCVFPYVTKVVAPGQ